MHGKMGRERNKWLSNVPVIGRHSRPARLKWPDTLDKVVSIYPIDGSMKVRILGGCPIIPKNPTGQTTILGDFKV